MSLRGECCSQQAGATTQRPDRRGKTELAGEARDRTRTRTGTTSRLEAQREEHSSLRPARADPTARATVPTLAAVAMTAQVEFGPAERVALAGADGTAVRRAQRSARRGLEEVLLLLGHASLAKNTALAASCRLCLQAGAVGEGIEANDRDSFGRGREVLQSA